MLITNSTPVNIACKKWFALFCLLHLIVWTLLPTFIRGNLPFDTIESIVWGNQWQWGYDKHPPLAAWLAALATYLGGSATSWPSYLLAQFAVLTAFWAIWRLGQRIFSPLYALIAVMFLEGIIYYNIISPKFNPTTLMTPIWALLSLIFYLAVTEKRYWQWLLVGLLAGLSILTKYQAPLILVSMFIVLLSTHEGRQQLLNPWLYAAALVALLTVTPHLFWLYKHNFPSLGYMLDSTKIDLHHTTRAATWFARIHYPTVIFFSQIGAMLAGFIMLLPFWFSERDNTLKFSEFQLRFVLIMGVGPLALTMLYALLTGSYLYSKWCTPYFSLLGILIMMYLRPVITRKKLLTFCFIFGSVFCLAFIGRYGYLLFAPYLTGKARADAYFPGHNIALRLTQQWHNSYHTKLRYVAGSHYLVANIAAYSPDKPVPYFEWSQKQSAWINEADLREKGALFVWWVKSPVDEALSINIQQRFPQAIVLPTQAYAKLTNGIIELQKIGVAYLPPQEK